MLSAFKQTIVAGVPWIIAVAIIVIRDKDLYTTTNKCYSV